MELGKETSGNFFYYLSLLAHNKRRENIKNFHFLPFSFDHGNV